MKSSLYLRSLEHLRECAPGYPGDTAVLRRFSRLDFSAPVTMLCGDNGCGKTTLIELLACKVRANRIGPPQGALTGSQRAVAAAADDFRVVMGGRPAHSFLFTAEGFSQYVATLTAEKGFARAELDGLPANTAATTRAPSPRSPLRARLPPSTIFTPRRWRRSPTGRAFWISSNRG